MSAFPPPFGGGGGFPPPPSPLDSARSLQTQAMHLQQTPGSPALHNAIELYMAALRILASPLEPVPITTAAEDLDSPEAGSEELTAFLECLVSFPFCLRRRVEASET
jgi:hypothetical protein